MYKKLFRSFSNINNINKFLYNHPIPENALRSKITNEPILSDKHGRFHNYLRISLTERCNLKCRYCVYDDKIDYTPSGKLLTEDEFLRLTKLFVRSGVTKIRLTGGDPTIYKGLSRFVREIGQMDEIKTLAMTTNGLILNRKLKEFKDNGLNALNISLDTFKPEKFEYISRGRGHKNVMKSIYNAMDLGFNPLKINCVVMKGVNDDEIYDFVDFAKNNPVNVRFIEFFPMPSVKWTLDKMYPFKELKHKIEERYGPLTRKNDHFTDTAKNYQLDGFIGSISFITSMSMPFCGTCNRIRLLSSGEFRRCLHDENMFNLKPLLASNKSDDLILEAISQHLKGKKKAHGGHDFLSKVIDGKQMIKIGG